MKTLYLLRHGKSESYPYTEEFDRPLNERGAREVKEMANYFKENEYTPETIICSSARRTKETLSPILEALNFQGEVKYLDNLYLASSEMINKEVENSTGDSILVVGHNPGIETFLNELVKEYLPMKTCQLAVIDMENVKLLDFTRPKDFK